MKLHAYILIIVFFLSTSLSTINAEPPPAQKLPKINGALTDFAETKFGGTEAIDILAGTTFGFELQDIILPIYKKAQQIAAPDFKPLGIGTMQTYNKYLIPESLNDTIIHYSDINENIATTIFCAVIRNKSKYGKNALTITKSGVQKSSNFEYSQEAFENLRKANALYGLQAVEPNAEGFLDFNLPSMYHPAGTAKCGRQYTSEEDKPVENDVTELASWGGGTGTVDVTNCCETLWDKIITYLANGLTQITYILQKFYPSYEAVLTENTRPSNFEQLAHAGDATEKDVDNAADEETKKLAKSRGLAFAYLPEEKSIDPNEHAGKTEYSYNIKSLSRIGNDVFDGKNGGIEHPWLLVNNAKFRTCQMARSVVPDGLTTGKSIGDGSKGDIVLDEKCPEKAPVEEPESCIPDTWDQITAGLSGAINKAAAKYAAFFPISQGQLSALLKVIFNMEMGLDTEHNGANYACEDNGSSAFGPFQIKSETYEDVTNNCSGEFIEDDIKQCNDEGLSRCQVEDAAELAARVLLLSGGRWVYTPNTCENREVKLSSMSELYTAVCNYGEGDTLLPHLGNKTYCQYAFEQLGWSIP